MSALDQSFAATICSSEVPQRLFTNMVRGLFNIDGYLLPELSDEHQREFVRDPVRYFIGTDKAQQNAIFREVMKRQVQP